MDHNSCSSSCSSCSSGSYSSYTSASSNVTSYEETPLALFQQLENEIGANIHLGVDLSRFAQEVWGLEEKSVDNILAMGAALDAEEVAAYREGSRDDDLHKMFLAISSRLLDKASKTLEDDANSTFTDTFWDRLRQNPTSRSRRSIPDVVNTWTPIPPDGAAPPLSMAKGICELKRIPREKEIEEEEEEEEEEEIVEEREEDEGVEERKEEAVVKEGKEDIAGADCAAKEGEEDLKRSKLAQGPKVDAKLGCSQETQTSQGTNSALKRSFSSVEDDDCEEGSAAKKQRRDDTPALSGSLLPLYATEAMASSSRYYVVGLVVDRFTVTVCYFDRFLVTCVASFSFDEEPSKLALVLYAMNRCDRLSAGFDPHLRALGDDKEVERALPVRDVVGSVFEYPATSFSPAISLRVRDVLRRPDELIGRATAVYRVQRRLPDGTFSEEELVYKLSWPSKRRLSEVDVVEALKKRLPEEAHVHLPDFVFTRTFTAEDLNLPWLRLGLELTADNHKDRVLRGMVGKFYHKLWEAGSVENFKKAWLDCVECLYLARKMGKILHRDLSEGNLMVQKSPGGEVEGVLNDWDMAKFTDGDEAEHNSDDSRTGTLPFMAFDLVDPTKHYPHWFRHDLESLFWILLWAALHYNLSEGTRDSVTHPAMIDVTGTLDVNCDFKNLVFATSTPFTLKRIEAAVKPEFAALYNEWIEPLRSMFVDAVVTHRHHARRGEESNEMTYNGMVTFRTFMEAINVAPRTWGIPNFLDGDDDF